MVFVARRADLASVESMNGESERIAWQMPQVGRHLPCSRTISQSLWINAWIFSCNQPIVSSQAAA
eukprot:1120267-Pyramimonas_sp.AAC.1